MVHGTTKRDALYVDIAAPEQRDQACLKLFWGRGEQLDPVAQISDSETLMVLPPDANPSDPFIRSRALGYVANTASAAGGAWEVLGILGLPKNENPRDGSKGRWAMLARAFRAVVDAIDEVDPDCQWRVRSGFHGGWESYYLFLTKGRSEFAIGEDGHFSMHGPTGVSLQEALKEGAKRSELRDLLIPGIREAIRSASAATA